MNKKLKIFIIGILLILVTGCSGNYNLKINDDMSIDEELYLTIDNTNNTYTKTLKIFKENNIPEKDYEVVLSDNNVRITYNKKYDSMEEYILVKYIMSLLMKYSLINQMIILIYM